MTTTVTTRIPRKLRNIDLNTIENLAESEGLSGTEMTRLLLSYGTYKWRPRAVYPSSSDGELSIKLASTGIDAIKTLAEREELSWDGMAARIVAFATATWTPGWRKDQPGLPGPGGITA